jgi:oligosaccharide repeat unit polymerase
MLNYSFIKAHILITNLLILIELIVWLLPASDVTIEINKYLVCFFFFFNFFSVIKLNIQILHPYILFLCSFGIFMLSWVFLDILGLENFNLKVWTSGYFNIKISHTILSLISFSLLFFHLGALFAFRQTKKYSSKCINQIYINPNIKTIRKIGLFLFFIALIPFLIRNYFIFSYILNNSYRDIYVNGLGAALPNPILRISDDIFLFGVFIYYSTYPQGKLYYVITVLYLLSIISLLAGGARGGLITLVFGFLSYIGFRRANVNKKKIIQLLIVGCVLIYITQIVGLYRETDFSTSELSQDSDLIYTFLKSKGGSIQTIGFFLEYEDKIDNKPLYFLSPIFNFFRISSVSEGQTVSNINSSYMLGYKLSYLIDPFMYFSGGGTGSSFIAEVYAAGGIWGTMILSFLWMFFFIYVIEKYKYSYVGVFILLSILPLFFWAPRASALEFVGKFPRSFFVIFVVQIYCYCKNKKNHIKNNN